MLHAGVLKKFGLYGLLRLALPLLPEGAQQWITDCCSCSLLGNIIYIGLVTIAQKRLDWMLGYSSVMHMGYIFLGIASAQHCSASTARPILMFAHGLSIALALRPSPEKFASATASLDLTRLGGLAKAMPLAALAFGLGSIRFHRVAGVRQFRRPK